MPAVKLFAKIGSEHTGLTKFVSLFQNSQQNLFSAKFLICQAWAHWYTAKIFVNHKFQSHGNKHHRLLAVRRKGYMRSQESSLTVPIEYVASTYYCLCSSFFASLNSFNSSRSSCYFYYASGGFSLFDCNVLVAAQRAYIEGETNSRIDHIPECIAFNQTALRHF